MREPGAAALVGQLDARFPRFFSESGALPRFLVRFQGYQCFRFDAFISADGFDGRACRGANIDDNLGEYADVYGSDSPEYDGTLAGCQRLCTTTSGCKGIEQTSSRCEVWTRPGGIRATAPVPGSLCLRYEPFTNVEGGVDRACRGEDPFDNWPSYYTVTSAPSVEECKQQCVGTPGCRGIEYRRGGRCEIWTRALRRSDLGRGSWR